MHSDFSVAKKKDLPYTRWLGVYFDRTLFQIARLYHYKESASSSERTSWSWQHNGRRLLKNLRQAAIACLLPIAYYGAETWWPDQTRSISPTRTILNLVKGNISLLQKVVHTSARAILSIYRTTTVGALYRDAGLPPPGIALDLKLRRTSLRIHHLDPRHRLRRLTNWIPNHQKHVSRLSRRVLSLPSTEFLELLVNPPWLEMETWCIKTRRVTRAPFRLPEDIPSEDLVVHLNGSRLESASGPRVECGFVIFPADRMIHQKRIALSPSLEIFDAESEALAALSAVETAMDFPSKRFANDLWVLLDNLDVARKLSSNPTCSFQDVFNKFASKAREWSCRTRLLHTLPGEVRVH